MDSVEESSKSVFSVMQASVMCCFGLLKAIEELSAGHCIPPKTAEILCQMFPKLMDCDYKGPRTYQSTARLPQRYRDSIEKEEELIKQKNDIECVLNKQDYDSDSSGDTEGPEERVKFLVFEKLLLINFFFLIFKVFNILEYRGIRCRNR